MRTKRIFFILALLCLLLAQTFQRLKVLSPDSLAEEFTGGKLDFTPAHYGDLPYGGSLVGFVHELETNHDGCRTIPQLDAFDDDDNQPILVVPRGGCQFLTKSLHAQHAGAKLLIVVNDGEQLDFDPVADVNVGKKVKIPTVFIRNSDGKKIMKILESADENVRRSVILELTLPLPTTDQVTLTVVMTAVDKQAYNFFTVFRHHTEQLGARFKIEPLFYWDRIIDQEVVGKDGTCYNGLQALCLPEVDFQRTQVHLAQMQQICLHENLEQAQFMEFLSEYGQSCLSDKSFEIHQESNSESTQSTMSCTCPDGSVFLVGTKNKDDTDCKSAFCYGGTGQCLGNNDTGNNNSAYCGNTEKRLQVEELSECAHAITLKVAGHRKRRAKVECVKEKLEHSAVSYQRYMMEKIEKAGIYAHPSLIVNGKAVYGSLSAENAFNAVCEAFIDPPASCAYVQNKYVMNGKVNDLIRGHASAQNHFWITNVFILLLIFGAAGGCFYVVFKKMYKNILATQIDSMVRESVQNYNKIDDGI
jgi:hypothetical protein